MKLMLSKKTRQNLLLKMCIAFLIGNVMTKAEHESQLFDKKTCNLETMISPFDIYKPLKYLDFRVRVALTEL